MSTTPTTIETAAGTRPPRLAVVTTVHRWGDPRVFERETAAWLEWGCEVHVFVPAAGPLARRGWSEDPRLRVHALAEPRGRRRRMALAFTMARRVGREGPFDLVHFHDPELIPPMAWLSLRWPRTYFLYDVHEELPLEVRSKSWIPAGLRPAASFGARLLWGVARLRFEGFAPATEAIARHWPPGRTRTVHNFPKALFGSAEGPCPSPDPDRVLFVGGLSEVRGVREMLAAVRNVRRERPGVRLELVGRVVDTSLEPDVRAAVDEGWCRHTPWLPPEQLAAACRGAGVGLVPYQPIPDHLEALPTKIFEYMAMGIPILASDFPLWRDLIERGGCGRVATPTADGLASALETMLADRTALESYAARGRLAYRDRFRWEVERDALRWHLERAMGAAGS